MCDICAEKAIKYSIRNQADQISRGCTWKNESQRERYSGQDMKNMIN